MRNGIEYVVWFQNDSRAAVTPLESNMQFRLRDSDGKPQFMTSGKSEDISPNSEVEILRSLGREGLSEFIDKRKQEQKDNPVDKKAKKAKKEKKEGGTPGTRTGALGLLLGFSVASTIRTLGKAGWTYAEVKALMEKEKVTSSDQTIKLNIYRGAKGCGGELAPIKDFPAKPKVEQKEKKSAKPEKKKEAKPGKSEVKKQGSGSGATTPATSPKKPGPGDKAAAQIAKLKQASKQAA
jgi:hypothetical protein